MSTTRSSNDFNDFKLEDIKPRPVVESKWREKKYTPEVATLDGNFILWASFDNYDEAMEFAEVKTKEIKDAMIETCRSFTKHLVRAKE